MDAKSNEDIKGKRKGIEKVKPTPEALDLIELYNMGQVLRSDPRYYTIYNMMIITGQRVSEALQLTGRDIKEEWIIDERTEESIPSLKIHSVTLKNRHKHTRDLIIKDLWRLDVRSREYISTPIADMWNDIKPRINEINKIDGSLKIWGDITRSSTRKYMARRIEFDIPAYDDKKRKRVVVNRCMYPHFLRHCRATNLGGELGLYELVSFFGWSSIDMALRYVHVSTKTR